MYIISGNGGRHHTACETAHGEPINVGVSPPEEMVISFIFPWPFLSKKKVLFLSFFSPFVSDNTFVSSLCLSRIPAECAFQPSKDRNERTSPFYSICCCLLRRAWPSYFLSLLHLAFAWGPFFFLFGFSWAHEVIFFLTLTEECRREEEERKWASLFSFLEHIFFLFGSSSFFFLTRYLPPPSAARYTASSRDSQRTATDGYLVEKGLARDSSRRHSQ